MITRQCGDTTGFVSMLSKSFVYSADLNFCIHDAPILSVATRMLSVHKTIQTNANVNFRLMVSFVLILIGIFYFEGAYFVSRHFINIFNFMKYILHELTREFFSKLFFGCCSHYDCSYDPHTHTHTHTKWLKECTQKCC